MIYEKLIRHLQKRLEELKTLPPGLLRGYQDHLEALRSSMVAVVERDILEDSYHAALASIAQPFEPRFKGGFFLDFREPLPVRLTEPAGPDQFASGQARLEAMWVFRGQERCSDAGCAKAHPYLKLNFYLNEVLRVGLKTYDEFFPRFAFETPLGGCCPAHSVVCPSEPAQGDGDQSPRLCAADMRTPSPCPTAASLEILMRLALRLLENLRGEKIVAV